MSNTCLSEYNFKILYDHIVKGVSHTITRLGASTSNIATLGGAVPDFSRPPPMLSIPTSQL